MKNILLLGSTGSIGVNTLSVVENFKDDFNVVGICANKSIDKILEQTKLFNIDNVYIEDKDSREKFRAINTNKNIKIYESIVDFINNIDFDILVNALVGYSGFIPTIEAIKRKKTIALANKETLVVGGDIIMPLAKEYGVDIIPIDSEHSAIFQIINHFKNIDIEKIIITASGGPFFNTPINEFKNITTAEALKHPTWSMGKKITIDSATMMNKGFEIIEAHHLFNVSYDKIEAIIHPQSIIHSMVEFTDGEIYAQLGVNDMRFPIQNALTYPNYKKTPFNRFDFKKYNTLNFFEVDFNKFKMLGLAYECGKLGGLYPAILNAANEVCVYAFLDEKIKFTDIVNIVTNMCEKATQSEATIESIIEVDKKTRIETESIVNS